MSGSIFFEQDTKNKTQPIENINDLPKGEIFISSHAVEGAPLSIDLSLLSDADGFNSENFNYQWFYKDSNDNDIEIISEASQLFIPGINEIGKSIFSKVSYVDNFQTLEKTTFLNDVVNVPARSDLMRGRFEKGYIDNIADMVKKMTDEIADTVEEN